MWWRDDFFGCVVGRGFFVVQSAACDPALIGGSIELAPVSSPPSSACINGAPPHACPCVAPWWCELAAPVGSAKVDPPCARSARSS